METEALLAKALAGTTLRPMDLLAGMRADERRDLALGRMSLDRLRAVVARLSGARATPPGQARREGAGGGRRARAQAAGPEGAPPPAPPPPARRRQVPWRGLGPPLPRTVAEARRQAAAMLAATPEAPAAFIVLPEERGAAGPVTLVAAFHGPGGEPLTAVLEAPRERWDPLVFLAVLDGESVATLPEGACQTDEPAAQPPAGPGGTPPGPPPATPDEAPAAPDERAAGADPHAAEAPPATDGRGAKAPSEPGPGPDPTTQGHHARPGPGPGEHPEAATAPPHETPGAVAAEGAR